MSDIVPFDRSWIIRCLALSDSPTVFFEIGAYDGADTAWLFEACKKPSRYFAFEPDPRNIRSFPTGRLPVGVSFYGLAVGAVEGLASFYPSADNHRSSSSLRKPLRHLDVYPHVGFIGETSVQVTTLDAFCDRSGIDRIDFLWADMQGAERDMVAGGEQILKKTKFMFLERMHHELYEGQWVDGDTALALDMDWGVVADFPDDVLLWNKKLFSSSPVI
jgi:FkbM family methyltransferase